MKNKLRLLFLTLTLLISSLCSFAQDKNLYAGIEIGSKGVKMSVIDVDNIKKGDFTVKAFWTENVGIAKGISIDGKLAQDDIIKAVSVVKENYEKIKKENDIFDYNIFIVGSSGVAMAKNTQDLVNKIKVATNKELEFIDPVREGKLLLKGSIPAVNYLNSMVLDIGGGNTKGGYVDVFNKENFVFFPVSFDYGTVTLTEAINKKLRNPESHSEYLEKHFGFLPTLRDRVKAMYNSKPKALQKENVYMSGGAVWAFYTLFNAAEAKSNFNEFKLEDVILYDAMIKNNFKKFETIAQTDKEVARVLKTYSHKHLISAK